MINLKGKTNNSNLNFFEVEVCSVSGNVKKLKEGDIYKGSGYKDLTIKISGENNYKVNSEVYQYKLIEGGPGFVGGGSLPYFNKYNLSKIGDEVNYLVESEDFTLITDKYKDGNFILASGEILQQEINACEVEKIKIEKDTIYIGFIGILIFVLMLLLFLLYKKIGKK